MLNRWLWIAVAVFAIDRYSKYWVLSHLGFEEPVAIFPFFNLTLAYNTGAAFSFLNTASGWQHYVLGGLALVVSICIVYWLSKLPAGAKWMKTALCLIMGGALSNALDRVLYGHVIDFLDFHLYDWHFAIFNVADSAICVGAFMLILHWLWDPK
jgi:signal peptidase II